jgi:protocatechuate 3,4-dioxygenase beta subunit
MFVEGRVTDMQGNGVADCRIETWETDEDGLYDTRESVQALSDELFAEQRRAGRKPSALSS